MNRKIVSSLSIVLPLAATVALAGGPGGRSHGFHHGPAPEERLERHLGELGLEPAQKEHIQEILEASKQAREGSRDQMREAFHRMHELLEQPSPDEDAVMQQAEKIGALKTEKHKSMLRTLLAVRSQLTPEQREQLREMKQKRGHRRWKSDADDRQGK